VILSDNLPGTRQAPPRSDGSRLVASIDVEWTKNYKIKNGNIPFCWSVTWLRVPMSHNAQVPSKFAYCSAYVASSGETQDLIDAADTMIMSVLASADLIVGHQLSSDIAILRNASTRPLPAVESLRSLWHSRGHGGGAPLVIDSRYDSGALLLGTSRRLVDVCTELRLDVTQPELARTSMTALHRIWLQNGDPSARERITVLNLRHGLSAAYVALRSANLVSWSTLVNVNQILARQLEGSFAWLDNPAFQNLLARR
jgi:hypothetical protein